MWYPVVYITHKAWKIYIEKQHPKGENLAIWQQRCFLTTKLYYGYVRTQSCFFSTILRRLSYHIKAYLQKVMFSENNLKANNQGESDQNWYTRHKSDQAPSNGETSSNMLASTSWRSKDSNFIQKNYSYWFDFRQTYVVSEAVSDKYIRNIIHSCLFKYFLSCWGNIILSVTLTRTPPLLYFWDTDNDHICHLCSVYYHVIELLLFFSQFYKWFDFSCFF